MLQVAINGKFVADRMQGIVRYARELIAALDDVLDAEQDRAHPVKSARPIASGLLSKRAGVAVSPSPAPSASEGTVTTLFMHSSDSVHRIARNRLRFICSSPIHGVLSPTP